MKLRAVLFDYGMVISAPACAEAHAELVQLFGSGIEIFDRCYWANRHAYDAGIFDGSSYWQKVARDASIRLAPEMTEKLVETDIRMWSKVNSTMVDWARVLAGAGLRIGMLSNINFELVEALERESSWISEFKYNTWSCRVRTAKPEPLIFKLAVENIQVPPEETLFIDDRLENIHAAQAVGLLGIVFRDVQQLANHLEDAGLTGSLPRIVLQPDAD